MDEWINAGMSGFLRPFGGTFGPSVEETLMAARVSDCTGSGIILPSSPRSGCIDYRGNRDES